MSIKFFLIIICSFLLYFTGLSESIIYFGLCPIALQSESCNSEYVKLYLYTRKYNGTPEYIHVTESSDNITSSNYKQGLINKVLIHGYNADKNLGALQLLKNEYLKKYDGNIWMVDYSVLVPGPCYPTSVYNAQYTGKCVAQFVDRLLKLEGEPDLHLVGHSLGAHVPANAAVHLEPYKVPRITGLDPAFPLFVFELLAKRLGKDAADFVDIVHTNSLLEGFPKAIGHADFFMNDPIIQPGCGSRFDIFDEINCSHERAIRYFAESVNTKVGFWGWRCPDFFYYITDRCVAVPPYVLMGENIDKNTRGTFSVDTNSESPFALGKRRIYRVHPKPVIIHNEIPSASIYYPVYRTYFTK